MDILLNLARPVVISDAEADW